MPTIIACGTESPLEQGSGVTEDRSHEEARARYNAEKWAVERAEAAAWEALSQYQCAARCDKHTYTIEVTPSEICSPYESYNPDHGGWHTKYYCRVDYTWTAKLKCQ
jgi:hypothetical protein